MSFNIVKNDKKRVIIVGGGFGGLKLANKLKKSGFQVVLVDKNNITSFLPLFIKSLQPDLNPVPSLSRSGRFFRNERTFTSVWQKYGPSSPKKI